MYSRAERCEKDVKKNSCFESTRQQHSSDNSSLERSWEHHPIAYCLCTEESYEKICQHALSSSCWTLKAKLALACPSTVVGENRFKWSRTCWSVLSHLCIALSNRRFPDEQSDTVWLFICSQWPGPTLGKEQVCRHRATAMSKWLTGARRYSVPGAHNTDSYGTCNTDTSQVHRSSGTVKCCWDSHSPPWFPPPPIVGRSCPNIQFVPPAAIIMAPIWWQLLSYPCHQPPSIYHSPDSPPIPSHCLLSGSYFCRPRPPLLSMMFLHPC